MQRQRDLSGLGLATIGLCHGLQDSLMTPCFNIFSPYEVIVIWDLSLLLSHYLSLLREDAVTYTPGTSWSLAKNILEVLH